MPRLHSWKETVGVSMGIVSQLELYLALFVLFPGMFLMTFPETWLALIGALLAGWFRLSLGAVAAITVASAAYIAIRVAITGGGQGWNIATGYGVAVTLGGALLVAVLSVLGYCLGRFIYWLVDRFTYG